MRALLNKFLILFGLLAASAAAASPFDTKAFEAAQAAGGPVLVEVHADWCPVCTRQKPIIRDLLSKPAFKGYSTFIVDFDSQKDVLKRLGVQRQSTLIVFKGSRELGRSTGVTDPAQIAALLEKAL